MKYEPDDVTWIRHSNQHDNDKSCESEVESTQYKLNHLEHDFGLINNQHTSRHIYYTAEPLVSLICLHQSICYPGGQPLLVICRIFVFVCNLGKHVWQWYVWNMSSRGHGTLCTLVKYMHVLWLYYMHVQSLKYMHALWPKYMHVLWRKCMHVLWL